MILRTPTTTAGEYRFSVDHDWARLPSGIRWGITHGIAIDRLNRIHVLHTGNPDSADRNCCFVFDPDGAMIGSWGADFYGSAHGLTLHIEDGKEVAYVTDLKRGLFKCRLDGEIIWHRERPEFYRKRRLNWSPSNVAVSSDGRVFLADGYGSYFIAVYDRDGHELGVIGGPGPEERHLIHPHGLSIDHRGRGERLVVCDNLITRLHYLDLDGAHLGTSAESHLVHPRHIAWHGSLMAVPDLVGRVTLFDADDRCLGHLAPARHDFEALGKLRAAAPSAWANGQFVLPHDAAFDDAGNLYVSEWVEHGRVSKLSRKA